MLCLFCGAVMNSTGCPNKWDPIHQRNESEEIMAKQKKVKKVDETITIAIGEDGPFVEYSGKKDVIKMIKILGVASARLAGTSKLAEGERELVLAYQEERIRLTEGK